MVTAISWHLFKDVIEIWDRQGFVYKEVPYWVSKEAIDMTFPDDVEPEKNRYPVFGTDRYLVASGEQSFAQMMIDGDLSPGRYMCLTPCFRDDPLDDLHQNHFMKLEVIDSTGADDALDMIIKMAHSLFKMLWTGQIFAADFDGYPEPTICETNDGYDILINGIEVGSYGFREANGFKWAYGTGMAQPRFQLAVAKGIKS